MSVDAGLYGAVTLTKLGSDPATAFVTGDSTFIEWTKHRELRPDVTPLHATLMAFAPDTPMGILKIKGFVNSAANKGMLNLALADVQYTPSILQPSQSVRFNGWIQQIQFISPIDDANRFSAIIFASDTLVESL